MFGSRVRQLKGAAGSLALATAIAAGVLEASPPVGDAATDRSAPDLSVQFVNTTFVPTWPVAPWSCTRFT